MPDRVSDLNWPIPVVEEEGFQIADSAADRGRPVSPWTRPFAAIACASCSARPTSAFGYPLINCTNCGRAIRSSAMPYDRVEYDDGGFRAL